MRSLKAGLLYFAAVFAVGFVLGVLRTFAIAPAVGERVAQLSELPLMVAAIVAAATWIVRRLALPPALAPRLGMGLVALGCTLLAEFALVLPLRGSTPARYLADLDPLTTAAYYGALVLMAAMPLFARPGAPRPGRIALATAAIALAAIAAVFALKFHHDIDQAHARVAHGSQVVETHCGPIEYASTGEGPAVLLVHGAGGGFDQTAAFAGEIAAKGFRVLSVSRFGYLRTPRPTVATPAAQADAYACLLDALTVRRVAIVGVSAGGPSSMQFALRHASRCSALVLLMPLVYAPGAAERLAPPPASARWMLQHAVKSDFLYWLAAEVSPSLVIGSILATPPYLVERADEAEQARIAWLLQQPLPLSARQEGLLNDVGIAVSLERYEIEHIHAPTLIISARDDFYGTYASSLYTAQHIAGARFVGIDEGGHLWVGHHRQVMGEIVSFLSSAGK